MAANQSWLRRPGFRRLEAMAVQSWALTDVGLRRDNNQDSILVDGELGLYVVADGMGGYRGGEIASLIAVETMQEILRRAQSDKRKPPPRLLLAQAYRESSHRIFDRSKQSNGELQGMGTTMVCLFRTGMTCYIANVGDSRAYLFRSPHLWQLTEDHSLVNEQVRMGLMSETQAHQYAPRNIITRSVGFERDVTCDIIERENMAGDVYVLCSDGLSTLVDDSKIAEILTNYPLSEAAGRCVEEAKKNGGDDNVSVIVVQT